MRAMNRFAGIFLAALMPLSALAQPAEFPTRPIRIIAPYPAGGPADIFARGLANQLTPKLGQPVLVENKSGAAGMAGTDFVAKSSPDGYTLVLTAGASLVLAPNIADVKLYDAFKDF